MKRLCFVLFIVVGLLTDNYSNVHCQLSIGWLLPLALFASAAGSIINSIGQRKSTASANRTNARIAEETNQSNERINASNIAAQNAALERSHEMEMESAEYQNQWNLDRWKELMAYNSPLSQYQRFMEAGINPTMAMMESGNVGELQSVNVGSPQSISGSAIPQQPYKVQPVGNSYEMLGSAIGSMKEGALLAQQYESNAIDNKMKSVSAEYQILQIETKLQNERADIALKLSNKDLNETTRQKLQSEINDIDERLSYFKEVKGLMRDQLQNANDLQKDQLYGNDFYRQLAKQQNARDWLELDLKQRLGNSQIAVDKASIRKMNKEMVKVYFESKNLLYDYWNKRDEYSSAKKYGLFDEKSATQKAEALRQRLEALLGKNEAEILLSTVKDRLQWEADNLEHQHDMLSQKYNSPIGTFLRVLFGGEVGAFGLLNSGYGDSNNSKVPIVTKLPK